MRTTKLERLKKDLEDTKKEIHLMQRTGTKSEILRRVIKVQIGMQIIKLRTLECKISDLKKGKERSPMEAIHRSIKIREEIMKE